MKIIRIFICIFLMFSVLFTVFYGRNKINENSDLGSKAEYKGVLNLWQVDSFEGGKGSRKQFLLKMAREFERKNEGVLVMVSDHTVLSVSENFNNGIYPDMISFGNGVNIKNQSEIRADRYTEGGRLGDKTYAVSWCRGGYVLIKNPLLIESERFDKADKGKIVIDNLLVSKGEFTQPLVALSLEDIEVKNFSEYEPMEAYVKFTGGKIPYLLGTQRDIIRLENRNMEVETQPVKAFNDLNQYISITTESEIKRYYSEKFINYLVSDSVQKRLGDIGMFSPYINNSFDNIHLEAMQKIDGYSTISVFSTNEMLNHAHIVARQYLSGDKGAINKIRKMVV